MKHRVFAIVALIVGATVLHAQKIGFWFDSGLQGGYGLTTLFNQNVWNDRQYDYLLSTGFSLGGKFGVYYGLYNGVNVDVMWSRGVQNFEFPLGQVESSHKVQWTTIDVGLLYRFQSPSTYFELGPMLSFVSSIRDVYVINEVESTHDASKYYLSQYPSVVAGVGGYLLSAGTFTLMFGMRAIYSLTDVLSEDGKQSHFPNPFSAGRPYETYAPTRPISLLFVLEANYAIGYFAKTACSDRMSFFRFD